MVSRGSGGIKGAYNYRWAMGLAVWVPNVKDENKTKAQLMEELVEARKRIAELEDSASKCKRAEEDLRATEERFRLAFNTSPDSICINQLEDGLYVDINEGFTALTGFTKEDVFGKTSVEIDIWHNPTERKKLVHVLRSKGYYENLEAQFRIKDGSVATALMSARVIRLQGVLHVVSITRDIRARQQAEKLLRESEARYRLITDNITDMIFTTDILGNYTFVSPSHKRVLERGEEVVGTSMFEHVHPDDLPGLRATVDKAAKSRGIARADFRYLHPSRGYIWLETEGKLIDMQGTLTGVLVSRDITARKHAEEERIKLEERLQQSYKMEAIGSLAGGIAHDFNNILSSILGFTEFAKMKLDDREIIENALDEIFTAGIRARDLVKQILTFSRQTVIKREPLLPVPIIKETLKFLRASLPVTIEIREDFPVSTSTIVADPTHIHQVIMNLCSNAAYAMKEKGGILAIRLAEVELDDDAELDFKGLRRGRYLRLSVTDTGCGIPKEIINRIFDPFFTTKERGEGTGMGLSVVHGIVHDMGGAISVYSDPGRGTTFNILLPLYEGMTVEAHALNTLVKAGRGRILFVDDEEGVIVSGRGILEQLGYEITSTTSPLKALELFTSDPNVFDLVLTDLTMPKMTGLELSEKLLKIRPDIPIVLCTGFGQGISPERIRDIGIREMVMKPMVASELSEAVYKALNPLADRQTPSAALS